MQPMLDAIEGRMDSERVKAFLGKLAGAHVRVMAWSDMSRAGSLHGWIELQLPARGGQVMGECAYGKRPATVNWSAMGDQPVEQARLLAQAIELVALIVEGKLSPLGDLWPEGWR